MSRIIDPPRSEISHLRTPLTTGESRLLDFFDQLLPQAWEIYVQPHLNGLRPDFVLLNPKVGIAVFEVKDWSSAQRGSIGDHRRLSIFTQVADYKQAILDLYCPRLRTRLNDDRRIAAVISAGMVLPNLTTAEASELLRPGQQLRGGLSPDERYQPISGGDALEAGELGVVFPEARRSSSYFMNETLARDLRSWLIEPDYAWSQRQTLPLDSRQTEFVTTETRTVTGNRRIKGPAGSGNSLVLAARASWLTAREKDVLVVTFNMTLWHYLRDLAVRYPVPGRSLVSRATWDHFHGWCKRVICIEADMRAEYKEMWAAYYTSSPQPTKAEEGYFSNPIEYTCELESLFKNELPALTERAIVRAAELGTLQTYDAILVDEGQDFLIEWWKLLQKVRRPDGEMWLVADDTQDLYGRSTAWTEAPLTGAGFQGRWARLEGSYRLPKALVPHLDQFVHTYIRSHNSDPPTVPNSQLILDFLEPFEVAWYQIAPTNDGVNACVDAVLKMPCFADPKNVLFHGRDTTCWSQ